MPSKKQLDNLKRGTAESAARARRGKAEHRAADEHLADRAREDPWAAYQELHATMTRHITKLLRAEEREGGQPSRNVTDRLREFRQTTEALSEYVRTEGGSAELQAFFDELDSRIAASADRLGPPQPPA